MTEQTAKTHCDRCGECCRKGGPALHLEDRPLVESGVIPLGDLFTIREGEPAMDNIQNALRPAATDIIKIKGLPGAWTCAHHDETRRRCAIYKDRPLECRVLKCWDTREIEVIYGQTRLTRRDLIEGVEGLWDLAQTHQKRCSYDVIHPFLCRPVPTAPDEQTRSLLLEKIRYDRSIRTLLLETGRLNPDLLDFLLGHPFDLVIRPLGLSLS